MRRWEEKMIICESEIPFWTRHHITISEINLNIRNQIGFPETDKEVAIVLNTASEIMDDVLSSYINKANNNSHQNKKGSRPYGDNNSPCIQTNTGDTLTGSVQEASS